VGDVVSNFSDFISSGGGGSEVNDIKAVNSQANLITTESGEKWLKSGVTDTAINDFPAAIRSLTNMASSSSNFNIAASGRGCVAVGSDIWVVYDSTMQKFANTGGSAVATYNLGNSISETGAIGFDGTHIWVASGGSSGRIWKYTLAGAYANVNFSVLSQTTTPRSLVWDGSHWHVCNYSNNQVYKYTAAGVFVSQYLIQGQDNRLTLAEDYLYGISRNRDVHKYTTDGRSKGLFASGSNIIQDVVTGSDGSVTGIAFTGTHFHILDRPTLKMHKFQAPKAVGLPTIDTSVFNGSVYTRIL